MKKFLSLLLASMMAFAMIPAMAEAPADAPIVDEPIVDAPIVDEPTIGEALPAETFPFTLEEYRVYFDLLSLSILGVTPEWAKDEDGLDYTMIGDLFPVAAPAADDGRICSLESAVVIGLEWEQEQIDSVSNLFGNVVALTGMSAMATEDPAFMTDADLINEFTTGILMPLMSVLGDMQTAMTEPAVSEAEVCGHSCSFSLEIDLDAMTMTLGFTFAP